MSLLPKLIVVLTTFALVLTTLVVLSSAAPATNSSPVFVGSSDSFSRYPIGLEVGVDSTGFPNFHAGGVYQQVYTGSAFSGPVTITQIAFASSSQLTSAPGTATYDFNIALSTTGAGPGGLSTNLAANRGPDFVQVFSGPLTAALTANNQFDVVVDIVPFTYDPANGNLLLDVSFNSPVHFTGGPVLYFVAGSGSSSSRAYDPAGTGANTDSFGLYTRFTTNTVGNVQVTLGNLVQTFDGNPKSVSVTTDPAGLNVAVTYNGSSIAPTNAGSYAVKAIVNEANFTGQANSTLVIQRANQQISFDALPNKAIGDADFNVSATASSNLAVSFSAVGNCTVAGTQVHLTGAGQCTITASQDGNSNYNPAAPVARSFSIGKIDQQITFDALSNKTLGDADFNVSATASSNLAVAFSAIGNCTVSGTQVHITGAGSCTITASQGGDSNYNAATDVPQTFSIAQTNNIAPDAVDDALTSVTEDSGMRTIAIASLLANDSSGPADESAQTLTFSLVGSSEVGGTVSNDATNVYFTPAANFNGPASFQYRVTDNGTSNGAPDPKSDTATASFHIAEVNDAPTAVNDTLASVAEGSGVPAIPFSTLTGNDLKGPANESSQTLIVRTVSNPVGGTVSILGGNVLFTPTANYSGPASFDYTVEDDGTTNGAADTLASGIATASFTITEVNRAPTALNDSLESVAEDSGERVIQFNALLSNDSKGPDSENGQTLTVTAVSNPVGGTVSIVAGTVRFTPAADHNGPASFQYTIEDNGTTNGAADHKNDTATVSFAITEVNDAPTANGETLAPALEDEGRLQFRSRL